MSSTNPSPPSVEPRPSFAPEHAKANKLAIVAPAIMFVVNALLVSILVVYLFIWAVSSLSWGIEPEDDRRPRDTLAHGKAYVYREGVKALQHILTLTPLSRAHTLRGSLSETTGQFDEALQAYREAVRLNPSSEHYFLLGRIARRMGNWELAADSFRTALATAAEWNEHGREALFSVLIESGQHQAARSVAESFGWVHEETNYCGDTNLEVSYETKGLLAMLVHPERADCLLPLGQYLTQGGLVNLARLVLNDRILNSGDPKVREKAAAFLTHRLPGTNVAKLAESLNIVGYNLQFSRRNAPLALQVYRKAIGVDPAFSWPYSNIGNLLKNSGALEDSIEWFEKAIEVNPNYWRAHKKLGLVLHKLHRYEEALPAYRRAVALNPEDAFAHSHLARVLMLLGERRTAVRELRMAVLLDPNRTDDQERLDSWEGPDPRRGPTLFTAF